MKFRKLYSIDASHASTQSSVSLAFSATLANKFPTLTVNIVGLQKALAKLWIRVHLRAGKSFRTRIGTRTSETSLPLAKVAFLQVNSL